MRQQAVILTYPAQFYITKACVDSIRKFFPEIKKILIIVDDTSELTWDSYVNDCNNLYGTDILQLSQVKELSRANELNFRPWIKQQLVKMHLDLFVPFSEFFFTDGDIIFRSHMPYNSIPWTYNPNYPGYDGLDIYTSKLLGLDTSNVGVYVKRDGENTRADTAAIPFRDIQVSVLKQLRNHVETKTGKDFLLLHKEIQDINPNYVSEWELIEVFKEKILNLPSVNLSVYSHYLPRGIDFSHIKWPYLISTLDVPEKELEGKFWDLHNISVDCETWNKMPNIKYQN